MKWYQTSDVGAGKADIEWIALGHATNAEISTVIHDGGGTVFSDIFETAAPVDAGAGTCPATFTAIRANSSALECLKLKAGMEKIASRLETRRYAAMLGATMELRKEEGITHDPFSNTLFVAMSEVSRGMRDNATTEDAGMQNDVRLRENTCGAVYALDLGPSAQLGSDYVAMNWRGVVEGRPIAYPFGSSFANNSCSINGIANPDNVTFIPGYDVLIIGEDTGSGHQNDAIWAYDMKRDQITRIQTTPYVSETTSPYWYPNINGWAYMQSVIQYPYGESDQSELTDPAQANAYVGYLGPFPATE